MPEFAASPPPHTPPRHRGRPRTITTQRLLEIARDVFLEHGIRATTEEVTRRAGVSHGVVFHRFGSKEALFRAAMRPETPVDQPVLTELAVVAGQGELRATLVALGNELLQMGRVALPRMMMAWSNPARALDQAVLVDELPRRDAITSIRTFFKTEQRLGRVAAADPHVLASMFIGPLCYYCMTELIHGPGTRSPSPQTFVEAVVDQFLLGVTVGDLGKSASSRHGRTETGARHLEKRRNRGRSAR